MGRVLIANRAALLVREGVVAVVTALLILAGGGLSQRAFAQGSTVIPPPPKIEREPGSGKGVHQAEQDLNDPERAFDPETGQNLYWDCVKKTWVDAKTGKSIGFQGKRAKDGEVVPPPPTIEREPGSGKGVHQAEQDLNDPERAFDPETGQNLVWDREQKTWKDTKTGKGIGFNGKRVKKDCPPPTKQTSQAPGIRGAGKPDAGLYAGAGYAQLKENNLSLGLARFFAGTRFGSYLGAEGEVSVGIKDQKYGSNTNSNSVGLKYSAIPFAVGYLQLLPRAELFARAGYGVRAFKSGGGQSNVSESEGRGVLAFGMGGQYFFGGVNGVRADYTRWDAGEGAGNVFSISYVRRIR